MRETGHQVLVLDKLTYAGNLDSLAPVSNNARYAFEQADVADGDRMRQIVDGCTPCAPVALCMSEKSR